MQKFFSIFGEPLLGEILIKADKARRRSDDSHGIAGELAAPQPAAGQR